jgi:hypothetical protein
LTNNGAPRISALTGDITYDATKLTPSSVATSVIGKLAQGNVVSAGVYRVTIYGGTSAFSDGVAASLCFKSTTGQCGDFGLAFASGFPQASDASASSVPLAGTGGKITVSGCGPSQELLLSQSRIRVAVEWHSQYSGQSGTAYALPQKDEFGYFYFSDPNNPEVFVKCLDFGSGKVIILVGGVTDFYYKVTFRNSRNETLVYEKPAGSLTGFANNSGLSL